MALYCNIGHFWQIRKAFLFLQILAYVTYVVFVGDRIFRDDLHELHRFNFGHGIIFGLFLGR